MVKRIIFLAFFSVHVKLVTVCGGFESWCSPLLSESLERSLIYSHKGLLCHHIHNLRVVKIIVSKLISSSFLGKAMRISLMTQTGQPSLSILYLVRQSIAAK